jgi:hypothetical protein
MQNSGERRRENMFACALTAPAGLIAPLALERELRDVGCSHGPCGEPGEVFAHLAGPASYIDPRGREAKSRKPNQFGMTKGSD